MITPLPPATHNIFDNDNAAFTKYSCKIWNQKGDYELYLLTSRPHRAAAVDSPCYERSEVEYDRD